MFLNYGTNENKIKYSLLSYGTNEKNECMRSSTMKQPKKNECIRSSTTKRTKKSKCICSSIIDVLTLLMPTNRQADTSPQADGWQCLLEGKSVRG
jgi:hypothetical protein